MHLKNPLINALEKSFTKCIGKIPLEILYKFLLKILSEISIENPRVKGPMKILLNSLYKFLRKTLYKIPLS